MLLLFLGSSGVPAIIYLYGPPISLSISSTPFRIGYDKLATYNARPLRLGALRAGEIDTRGIDFTENLTLIGDAIVSVTSVVASRVDGGTMGVNDLTITPIGAVNPWITDAAYGKQSTLGPVVNWWQSAGASIATPNDVDYKITIKAVTATNRNIIRDCYQLVVSGLG